MADPEDASPPLDPSRGCSKKVRTILHGVIVAVLFFVIVFTYVYFYRACYDNVVNYATVWLSIELVAYVAVGCLYICNSSGGQEKIISAGFLVLVMSAFFLSSIDIVEGDTLCVDYVFGTNIVVLSSYCVWKLSFILQYCSRQKRSVRIMLHGAVVAILLWAIVLVYSLYRAAAGYYPDLSHLTLWLLGELAAYNAVGWLYICNSSGRKGKIISAGFLLVVLFVFLLSSFAAPDNRVDFIFAANIVAISSYCIWKLCNDAVVLAWLLQWLPVPAARGGAAAAAAAPRKPARQQEEDQEAGVELSQNKIRIQGLLREFTSDEIRAMTQNFGSSIGKGAFAEVFRGKINDDSGETEVAVKWIKQTLTGEKSIIEELKNVATAHHRSLVPLLGYCLTSEGGKANPYLVYPFFENGSLDKLLFHGDEKKRRLLTWPKRYRIAVDVADALAYLHNQCRTQILHLDVKPDNILLDSHLRAVVSDFGISLSVGRTTDMPRYINATGRGTFVYMAPEMLWNEVSDKCDVYSYGLTLLELVCGRGNMASTVDASSPATPPNSFFPKIVEGKMKQGKLMEMVDAAMAAVDKEAVEAVVKVALCCIQYQRDMRPSMQQVVDMLVAPKN